MIKYFLVAALFASISLQCLSQNRGEDIAKIDSLEKLLPSLKGTANIDCMVSICEHYYNVPPAGKYKFKNDSIRYYGTAVFNKSKSINYKKGIAEALLILATDSVREKNIREAVHIGEELSDDVVLGWGYYNLALITDAHKDFQQKVDYYKKSIYHFHKVGNTLRETEMNIWLSEEYYARGEYEAAFDYAKNGTELLKSTSHEFPGLYEDLVYYSAFDMSYLFSTAGDYETAMNYLRMATQRFNANNSTEYSMSLDIAGLFSKMGKYDSAMMYWVEVSKDNFWFSNLPNAIGFRNTVLGDIYLGNKQYDKAIEVYKNCYQTFDTLRKYNYAGFGIMEATLGLAEAYNEKANYHTALQYAKKGTVIAQQRVLRPQMMQGYELLSSIYHHLENNDSAYEYLLKYNTIKDSIQNRQLLLRIYNSKKDAEDEKKQSQLMLLNKDNKIKDAQLKQQSLVRNFLISGILVLIVAGIFIFRTIALKRKNEKLQREQLENKLRVQQLENEKKRAELQQQATELEMQALRAQMNPHFIFNCLSSINRFILKNEGKTASNYLTRFSRLIRMVLMNSQKPLIALEEELQMLRLYLDMERLRFKDSFDYGITFLNTIESDNIFIPPLLLQPFCENAIWHGLMHKEDHGHLDIELSMQNNILNCTIKDNGIGRERAEEMRSKSAEKGKSMGLKITTERLALLNREKGVQTFYQIEDLLDENGNAGGTKVNLRISYKESIEESV